MKFFFALLYIAGFGPFLDIFISDPVFCPLFLSNGLYRLTRTPDPFKMAWICNPNSNLTYTTSKMHRQVLFLDIVPVFSRRSRGNIRKKHFRSSSSGKEYFCSNSSARNIFVQTLVERNIFVQTLAKRNIVVQNLVERNIFLQTLVERNIFILTLV